MGHYYKQDGEPCYYVEKNGGGLRDTTIRDARKLNLVPSVTEILKVADKPGLNKWLIDQHILSALTVPRDESLASDELIKLIRKDANEQSKLAREKGSEIHDALERFFLGNPSTYHFVEYSDIFDAAKQALLDEFGEQVWIPEKPFASPLGYGGKCDIHCPIAIIDFKTTDKPLDGLKCWDEHKMQGSAYKHGLSFPDAATGNLFISTKNIGEVRLIMHDDTTREWGMFKALLNYWKLLKGYDGSLDQEFAATVSE